MVKGQIVFPQSSPQLSVLAVEEVKAASVQRMRLSGRLIWDDDLTVRIFSPFGGRVTRIEANLGKVVGRDDVLASISSPDFGQAQADAQKAATDLALAEDRKSTRLNSSH